MSRLIDLLEAQGFIVRQDHPLDRRVKVIQLTAPGIERLAVFDADLHARGARVLSKLSPDEIGSLKDLLGRLVLSTD